MFSGALLSDKSARQCLTKNSSNKMRTGGRYGQNNLLFTSSSLRAPHNRVASKIDGWSPCACILFSIIQATVKVERRLCAFTASIMFSLACGALLYQPYCKCPKFGPKIGRARSWPSRRPAALYECFLSSGPEFLVGS